jgi:hypothetical protein
LPDLIPIVKEQETSTSSNDNEKLDEQNEIQFEGTTENQLETTEPEKENDVLEQQSDMIKYDSRIRQDDTIIGTISPSSSVYEVDTSDDGVADTIKQIQHSFETIENLKNLRITEKLQQIDEVPKIKQVVPLKKACHEIMATKSNKFFTMNALKIHEWPKSKNIKVKLQTFVQHPNVMAFVEDKKVIEHFYDFMNCEIQKYRPCISEDYHKYLPKTNEIVLGHYNGSWYRAIVLDSDPKGVIVLFIDYGNMEILLTDEILPISNEYFIDKLSFEVCSRQFIVDNVPAELDEKQQEILDSKSMMITNIRVDENGLTHCEIFGF